MGDGLQNTWVVLPALAILILVLGTISIIALARRAGGMHRTGPLLDDDRAVFLFEDGELLDATPKARALLRRGGKGVPDRDRVVALLVPIFPGIAQWMRDTEGRGRYRVQASGAVNAPASALSEAEIEYVNGRIRLTLMEAAPAEATHPLAIAAMEDELASLRQMSEKTEELSWAEAPDGAITWANASYLALADASDEAVQGEGDGSLPAWPPKALFAALPQRSTADGAGNTDESKGERISSRRVCLGDENAQTPLWFDVRSIENGDHTIHFARDAGDLVNAEKQSRMFVQTLTKTFAHLSIGLAIFDKGQRLSTFNPALLDLTGLPIEFLSVRPTLGIVLDRLREAGILQEPRNYRSWKQGVTDLVDAATEGTYCETWTLPAGQTYRVSGRPHPDGAIALLFEDISAEISLTRAFRGQIETAQSVLDKLDDSIGIFSAAGTLTTCNVAFEAAWSPGLGAGSLDQVTLAEAVTHWKTCAAPTPLWDVIFKAACKSEARVPLNEEIRLADGRVVSCRFDPLPAGAAMFRFSTPRTASKRASRPTKPADQPKQQTAAAG